MDQNEKLLIERECERLVTAYCHYVDHGEAERIAELFSEDGVWTSAEATMDGREAIRKAMAVRQANVARMSRHVCNNFLLDIIDADHAEGTVYLYFRNKEDLLGCVFDETMDEVLAEARAIRGGPGCG